MMEELWQEQPKTLMQLVHKMKEKQGWQEYHKHRAAPDAGKGVRPV